MTEASAEWDGSRLSQTAAPMFRPTADAEAQRGEWFGAMDAAPIDCLPRNVAWTTLPTRYLAVLRDRDPASATRASIVELLGAHALMYASVPLVEMECAEELARQIAALPGVELVLPALENVDSTRAVAIGLDLLASYGELQRAGAAEGSVIGGRTEDERPGYPIVACTDDRVDITADPSIRWPTEAAIMPVINLSLGTKPIDYPFLLNDIVNLATYGLGSAGVQLVVMSAGNGGSTASGRESMSAWAQAPWVLSVGATSDAEGTTLAGYSGRGVSGDPQSGPDLVAWGRSEIAPHPIGTSFAAPRVTYCAMICAAAILELRHGVQVATNQQIEGVRLVGAGFIDSWGTAIWADPFPRMPVPALPVIGLQMDGIAQVARVATTHGIELDVRGSAGMLRALLLAAAQPVAEYGPHEVGAGFVSAEIVLDHLATLTGAEVLEMFGAAALTDEVRAEASRFHVFDRGQLGTLAQIVAATSPQWRYDWRRQRVGARPAHGEALGALSDEERVYGIAVTRPPASHIARGHGGGHAG